MGGITETNLKNNMILGYSTANEMKHIKTLPIANHDYFSIYCFFNYVFYLRSTDLALAFPLTTNGESV